MIFLLQLALAGYVGWLARARWHEADMRRRGWK
jgi:hypothetical protein